MKRKNVIDVPVDFKYHDSLSYKVIFEDGTNWKTYRITEAKERFVERGTRLYAYTKKLFPITILIAWK